MDGPDRYPPAWNTNPETQFVSIESVREKLSGLSDTHRIIVYFHLVEGMTEEETAAACGVSRRTVVKVKGVFTRAIKKASEGIP